VLQDVHFVLGVEEAFGHGVAKEGVAFGVEGGDIAVIQGHALFLAFVEGAPFFAQALVLLLGGRVRHEGFDALEDFLELGMTDDQAAQFQGLFAHGIIKAV
jgi:hypothetical protein